MESSQPPETPAPYGKSCSNCSKAKCRCVYRNGSGEGSRCERCRRLNRECVPSVYARKRVQRKTAGSRTAHLERKLDDLVSILKNQAVIKAGEDISGSSQPQPQPQHDLYTPPQTISTDPVAPSGGSVASPNCGANCTCENCQREPAYFDCAPREQESAASILSVLPCPGEPTPQEAEQYLDHYRSSMSAFLPFVYLPPGMTASRLRSQRPFLWLCIMCVAGGSRPQPDVLTRSIMQIVANKVMLEEERSLDILIGLLVFLGWAHWRPYRQYFLGVYTGLALSIARDLSLDKPLGEIPPLLYFKPGKLPKAPTVSKERAMDERRAVLGAYLLSSGIFTSSKRVEALGWTSHMDDCLRILEEQAESESDLQLATLVKMQLIVEQVHRGSAQNGNSSSGKGQGLPSAYLDTVLAQLKRIQNQFPTGLENRAIIMCHYYYAELRIHEAGVNTSTPSSSNNPDYRRFAALNACLQALKKWFDVFFTMPNSAYVGCYSLNFCSNLAHGLLSLQKLTALDEPAWDRTTVRNTIDLFTVCDRLIDEVEYVLSRSRGSGTVSHLLTHFLKVLKSFRTIWRTELASTEETADKMDVHGFPLDDMAAQGAAAGDVGLGFFADDSWLADIFPSSHPWE